MIQPGKRKKKPVDQLAGFVSKDTSGARARLTRGSPSTAGTYSTRTYNGRTYYYKTDPQGRIVKYQGLLAYVSGGRTATKKTRNKRVGDQNGHLIAHSLGGDPHFTLGYVAMKARINQRGGDWYRMEHYIRERLKTKGTKVYMAVKPHYPTPTLRRPDHILVSVLFNRTPFKVRFRIDTP